MKILFSVHGYKPAWRIGGPIVSVSSLAETLVKKGHQVTVFTTNSNLDEDLDVPTDREIDVDGVAVRYFRREEPLKRLFPKFAYLSKSLGTLYAPDMAGALERCARNFDVLHTHLPFVYPTFATARAALRFDRPLFYHQRGVFDPERLKFRALKKSLYLACIEKPILRRATTLIALTEAERESYAGLGIRTHCRVIPNGISLPEPMSADLKDALLKPLGIDAQKRVILFMSRLHPIKGADRLLQAFERIAERHPDAVLVLAGPDEFGIEQGFRARTRRTGIAEKVRFAGMVHGDLKSALLHRADLFCLPSDAEGFSMAILEALAHRTPVLISPRCHFPAVQQSGAGRIVPPQPEQLAAALDEMLALGNGLASMGEAGRALVSTRYTWESVATSMVEAYEEGIDRHRRRNALRTH